MFRLLYLLVGTNRGVKETLRKIPVSSTRCATDGRQGSVSTTSPNDK